MPALRRAHVVRRHDEERRDAGFGRVHGQLTGLRKGLRPGGRHHGQASGGRFHRDVHEAVALLHREQRGLRRRPVDEDAVGPRRHLGLDEAA